MSSMKKCYINSFSRQMGVTQVNRNEKNASNRDKYKETAFKELQVVNYGWNLRAVRVSLENKAESRS